MYLKFIKITVKSFLLLGCFFIATSFFTKMNASVGNGVVEAECDNEFSALKNGKNLPIESNADKADESPLACPICFDEKTQQEFDEELILLSSRLCQENHYMCLSCLRRCLKQNPTCPMCRRGMIFSCRNCKLTFGSAEKLEQHKEATHTFRCTQCVFVSAHKCELFRHLRTHQGKRCSKARYCTCKKIS